MSVLVTGAAGFIGFHVCRRLLQAGEQVFGVDHLDDGYDVGLKRARVEQLQEWRGFAFACRDVAEEGFADDFAAGDGVSGIVHLAAQSAVRKSLQEPFAYGRNNIHGHLVMCELARRLQERGCLRHFLFASSSSVYGGNEKIPSGTEDAVEKPLSLYAASKRCDEVLTQAYVRLFGFAATGLRFFTVYGSWGRPDMALFQFAEAILNGREIVLFNGGDMERDFVYIDDVAGGIVSALEKPPPAGELRLYNLGSGRMESLGRVVSVLEDAVGKKARVRLAPMQPGDPQRSCADMSGFWRDFGFAEAVSIDQGIPVAVDWYRDFYGI